MPHDLFKEILPSILKGKQPLDIDDKDYSSWLVNQALSYHIDTVLLCSEMNRVYNLDKKMQYDFLFYAVKKVNRPYQSWAKKIKSDDLSAIKQYFNYSTAKANEIINILTKDQINDIKKALDVGGIK